jgi:hypothetical protein
MGATRAIGNKILNIGAFSWEKKELTARESGDEHHRLSRSRANPDAPVRESKVPTPRRRGMRRQYVSSRAVQQQTSFPAPA